MRQVQHIYQDWFQVEAMDDTTFAIREPRYWQHNINFLILGESRALLFDSGPGKRNIASVVRELTSLPVTVFCSHTHWDHIGNHHRFDRVAMADIPEHRRCARGNTYRTALRMGLSWPPKRWRVSDWWAPGTWVDLGGRRLEVLHVPGHTPDSCALYDPDREHLFLGDFIYPDELVAFAPGSDLPAYLDSTHQLMRHCPEVRTLFCGHVAPRMHGSALHGLARAFRSILDGSAPYARRRLGPWRLRRYPFADFAVLTRSTPASRARAEAALLRAESG